MKRIIFVDVPLPYHKVSPRRHPSMMLGQIPNSVLYRSGIDGFEDPYFIVFEIPKMQMCIRSHAGES
jgi:hypothetical protein